MLVLTYTTKHVMSDSFELKKLKVEDAWKTRWKSVPRVIIHLFVYKWFFKNRSTFAWRGRVTSKSLPLPVWNPRRFSRISPAWPSALVRRAGVVHWNKYARRNLAQPGLGATHSHIREQTQVDMSQLNVIVTLRYLPPPPSSKCYGLFFDK